MLLLVLGLNNSVVVFESPCEGGKAVRVVVGDGKGGTVLAYSDDWQRSWDQTHLYKALQWLNANLGYTFTYHWSNCTGQYANFLNDLQNNGPWELIAVDHPSCYEFGSNVWDDLYNWVVGGGKLVISEYDLDGDQIFPYDQLWNELGAQGPYTDLGTAYDLYLWDTQHPIALYTGPGGPDPLPSYFTGYWDDWADDGDGVYKYTPPGDTVMLLGGLTPTPQDGQALLVATGPAGDWPCQTILISILLAEWQDGADTDGDGMNDAVELWRNAIWAVKEGCRRLLNRETDSHEREKLLVKGDQIVWTGSLPTTFEIYTPSGRLARRGVLQPGEGARLEPGLWLVRAAGERVKVLAR